MDRLSELLSRWIAARDRNVARHQVSGGSQMSFLRDLRGHALQLGEVLPGLSIAQLEALCELSSSLLGERRLQEASFKK